MEKKDDDDNFKYSPDDSAPLGPEDTPSESEQLEPKPEEPLFNWSAPDSFSPSKSILWYFGLIGLTLLASAVVYILTRDKITTAVILVSGLLVGIYAGKKPRTMNYQLTKHGFTINGRYYEFGSYRSFSVVHQGSGGSAVLTPLKRFLPYMYIYYELEVEEQIVTALADVLPKELSHRDAIDKFLRRVGF